TGGKRKGERVRGEGSGPRRGAARTGGAPVARLFVGAGREAGVRPQDLVGAITGESSVSGREIGNIDIEERFSIVEVAADVAGEVIHALHGNTIKGRKV